MFIQNKIEYLVGMACIAAAVIDEAVVVAGDAPNILLIVADDLGYNDVSWHNQEIHTPNLEKLGHNIIPNSLSLKMI